MIDKSIFITRFKDLCKLKKKTQAEIAEILGISVNGLKHYMRKNNNTFPPVEYLDLMAKEFDVDIAYLIGEIDTPKHSMLTVANTTGLRTRERDFQFDLQFDDKYNTMMQEQRKHYKVMYSPRIKKRSIKQYADRTYAIDLISYKSKDFSREFCDFIEALANSNKIDELTYLFDTLTSFKDNKIVLIRTPNRNNFDYAYNAGAADKKILKNRIVSLFNDFIEDNIYEYSCNDYIISEQMTKELINFIELNYFKLPREKMIKIIKRRIEEIYEIDNYALITKYTPTKILGGYLIKLANLYECTLSPEFLEKYKPELSHSLDYYINN